jgi:hypothetical protein
VNASLSCPASSAVWVWCCPCACLQVRFTLWGRSHLVLTAWMIVPALAACLATTCGLRTTAGDTAHMQTAHPPCNVLGAPTIRSLQAATRPPARPVASGKLRPRRAQAASTASGEGGKPVSGSQHQNRMQKQTSLFLCCCLLVMYSSALKLLGQNQLPQHVCCHCPAPPKPTASLATEMMAQATAQCGESRLPALVSLPRHMQAKCYAVTHLSRGIQDLMDC